MGASYAAQLVYGVPIEEYKTEATKYNPDTGEPYTIETMSDNWRITGTETIIERRGDDWWIGDTQVADLYSNDWDVETITDDGKGDYFGRSIRVREYDNPVEINGDLMAGEVAKANAVFDRCGIPTEPRAWRLRLYASV